MKFQNLKSFFSTKQTNLIFLLLCFFLIVVINELNIHKFSQGIQFEKIEIFSWAQRALCYGMFSAFAFFFLNKKREVLRFFLLTSSLTYFFYIERFLKPYLFQDDYYHYLAIIRGDFVSSLFIPFVDHVSPIWRLVQYINIQLFGSYYAIATLPFIGAIIVGLTTTTLYYVLKKNDIKNVFLISMLLICYPGYRNILFWVSTNAIALSAIFGLISLAVAYKINQSTSAKKYDIVLLLVSLCCSFFSWTTGIVYPIFLIGIAFFNILLEKLFGLKENTKLNIPIALTSIASIGIFAIARLLAYKIYTPEFVTKLLWLKNGLEHGYERNLLRPLIWPFFSVSDSLILSGGFGVFRNNENFLTLLGGGIAFFILILFFSIYKTNRYLFFAYAFAFLSFAVVFAKRGMGGVDQRIPHGYFNYALVNDWYRISALGGTLFLLGISTKYISSEKHIKYLRLFLIFILVIFTKQSLYLSTHPNGLAELNKGNTIAWSQVRCLDALNWNPEDFYYASTHIFAPMRGANPGGYWLGYEPSWFDMKAKANNRALVFQENKLEQMTVDIEKSCGKDFLPGIAKQYAFTSERFDLNLANSIKDLSHNISENTVEIPPPSQDRCPWAQFQLLDLELTSKVPNATSSITLKNNLELAAPLSFKDQKIHLGFDLRALTTKEKCLATLRFTVDSDIYDITKITAIKYLE